MGGRDPRLNDIWPGFGGPMAEINGASRMEGAESQIAEWRAYVARRPGINGRDVDELEDHLRHQIADLDAAGLTSRRGVP